MKKYILVFLLCFGAYTIGHYRGTMTGYTEGLDHGEVSGRQGAQRFCAEITVPCALGAGGITCEFLKKDPTP